MDKNHHLHGLIGGNVERIGDWTPQQLQAFILAQSNDPTQMPHAFGIKSINIADHLVVGGKQFEHAVIPRGVTMGDRRGRANGAYPVFSGSAVLNRAYKAANPGPNVKNVFAESYDMRSTDAAEATFASGQIKMAALYVPIRERLTNMYVNYTTFEAGGTFTYGGWALYGPLAYVGGAMNITAVPQVAITETNLVSNFRATGPHFVSNGMHAMTGNPAWDLILEPGIYFACGLYVFSVAPGTQAGVMSQLSNTPGVATSELAVPGFVETGFLNGQTVLPATLDVTAFSQAVRRIWVALYDDGSKEI